MCYCVWGCDVRVYPNAQSRKERVKHMYEFMSRIYNCKKEKQLSAFGK